ncbi:hypothetical protein E2320_002949 [Naja naja]|nr:hypothetical protein E2320_002949 [Naja naja]
MYFAEIQWALLDPCQRPVYRDIVQDNFGTLLSLVCEAVAVLIERIWRLVPHLTDIPVEKSIIISVIGLAQA